MSDEDLICGYPPPAGGDLPCNLRPGHAPPCDWQRSSKASTWVVTRKSSANYLGAYEWVRNAAQAAHFITREAAELAATVARESNGDVEVVAGLASGSGSLGLPRGDASKLLAEREQHRDRADKAEKRLADLLVMLGDMQRHHALCAEEDVIRASAGVDPDDRIFRARGLRDGLFASKLASLLDPMPDLSNKGVDVWPPRPSFIDVDGDGDLYIQWHVGGDQVSLYVSTGGPQVIFTPAKGDQDDRQDGSFAYALMNWLRPSGQPLRPTPCAGDTGPELAPDQPRTMAEAWNSGYAARQADEARNKEMLAKVTADKVPAAEPCENCNDTGVVSHLEPDDDEECECSEAVDGDPPCPAHPRPSEVPPAKNALCAGERWDGNDYWCMGCGLKNPPVEHRPRSGDAQPDPQKGRRLHGPSSAVRDPDDWAAAMAYAESAEAEGLQDYRRGAIVALADAFAERRREAARPKTGPELAAEYGFKPHGLRPEVAAGLATAEAIPCAHPGTKLQHFDHDEGDRIAAWCECCGAFRLAGYAQWHEPKSRRERDQPCTPSSTDSPSPSSSSAPGSVRSSGLAAPNACAECKGFGRDHDGTPCDVCHGDGTVEHEGDDAVCPECDGTGTEDPKWRAGLSSSKADPEVLGAQVSGIRTVMARYDSGLLYAENVVDEIRDLLFTSPTSEKKT